MLRHSASRLSPRILVLLATLAVGGCASRDDGAHQYSGIVDATTVRVSAKSSGAIAQLSAEEGTTVTAGQTLAVIETDKTQAQLEQNAGLLEELDQQIQAAEAALAAGVATRDNLREKHRRFTALLASHAVTQQAADDLATQLDAAEKQVIGGQRSVAALRGKRRQAEAGRVFIERQLGDAAITAPLTGTVLVRYAERGEVAAPGTPICEIADLARVWTKVYIEETQLAAVRLGQQATIRTDGAAARTLTGTVSWISDKAEFTPKTILTEETRTALVYAVKIAVDNSSGALKIGMPVTVTLRRGS
jgi:HlyD family secretion protein